MNSQFLPSPHSPFQIPQYYSTQSQHPFYYEDFNRRTFIKANQTEQSTQNTLEKNICCTNTNRRLTVYAILELVYGIIICALAIGFLFFGIVPIHHLVLRFAHPVFWIISAILTFKIAKDYTSIMFSYASCFVILAGGASLFCLQIILMIFLKFDIQYAMEIVTLSSGIVLYIASGVDYIRKIRKHKNEKRELAETEKANLFIEISQCQL